MCPVSVSHFQKYSQQYLFKAGDFVLYVQLPVLYSEGEVDWNFIISTILLFTEEVIAVFVELISSAWLVYSRNYNKHLIITSEYFRLAWWLDCRNFFSDHLYVCLNDLEGKIYFFM